MSRFRILACSLVAALAVGIVGCTPSGVPDTPDGTVEAVCKSLAANQPGVAWSALPPTYQSDIDGLVQDFAGKMDAQLYDKTFVVLGKLVQVLKTKKDFILAHPMLADAPIDKKELTANWDSVIAMLEIPLNSELKTIDGLKSLDIGDYLSDTGADLMEQLSAVSKLAPAGPDGKSFADQMASLADVKVEIVSTEGENAKLKLTVPGEPTEEVELTKVDGKWLPKELVDNWDKTIAEAKESLAAMNPAENKAQMMGMLGGVEGALDSLLAAETQEDFTQQFGGLMGQVMGGMMGGGMAPPGGGMAPPGGVPDGN